MPSNFGTATVITKRRFEMTWLTIGGDSPKTAINEIPSATTDANLNAMALALAALSNAAHKSDNRTTHREVSTATLVAYDEAYADAKTRLILVFQNDGLDTKEVSVPAPDAALFGTDGFTAIEPGLDDPSPGLELTAAISAVLAVINTGGGSYAYIAGYRSPLPAGASVRPLPNPEEPGVGNAPSDLPAVGGE